MKPLPKQNASSRHTSQKRNNRSLFARAFIKRVQNTAHQGGLWKSGTSFIVGVSGGADSLCLLDTLCFLAPKYNFSIHVVHINYGLRGKDSTADEALVRKQVKHYKRKLTVFRPMVKKGGNLEERLRELRYQYFEKVRKQKKADVIAIAHHQDDQAETLLLRLLRGAGPLGLSAMQLKNGSIVRPFLKIPKQEIIRYMKELDLPFREDASNADPSFMRNRIRHTLLPLLESDFQPRIKEILAQTAEILTENASTGTKISERMLSLKQKDGFLEFSRKEALALPKGLLALFLRELLSENLKQKMPGKRLVDELIKCLKSAKNKPQMVHFRGLKLEAKGDTVRLFCKKED
mgnify:FL=1